MVHAALWVDFWLEAAGCESQLSALDDVEIVVCCVPSSMPFCPDRCAKDDQVFGYACCDFSVRVHDAAINDGLTSMDDVHSSHSTTSIIEDPFFVYAQIRC